MRRSEHRAGTAGEWQRAMIHFRAMLPDEFAEYRAYFIPDYAAEISENYGASAEDGLAQAEEAIARDLPLGVQTPDQVLLCILDGDRPDSVLGYLWYRREQAARSIFLLDFCILPPYRGTRLGQAALRALESQLREEGYREIRLRVAADNARARHVYERVGFSVTGVNMIKRFANAVES